MTLDELIFSAIEVLISRHNSRVIRGGADDEWWLATDTAITALRDMLKRSEGCKWCIGKVNDKYATIPHAPMIHATKDYPVVGLDVPYRFCCNCGRELSGNAEQVKEVEG